MAILTYNTPKEQWAFSKPTHSWASINIPAGRQKKSFNIKTILSHYLIPKPNKISELIHVQTTFWQKLDHCTEALNSASQYPSQFATANFSPYIGSSLCKTSLRYSVECLTIGVYEMFWWLFIASHVLSACDNDGCMQCWQICTSANRKQWQVLRGVGDVP